MLRATAAVACVSILVAAALPADDNKAGLGPCLLVSAGSGSKANSEKVTHFWQTVNAEIAKSLVEQLTKDGVAARLDVLPQDTASDKVPGLIALALARERCDQLMQFTHELGGGSGPEAYFAFEAAVFGVQEVHAGSFQIGKEAFRKKYRFAMTDEVLKTLSVSEVAGKLQGDLASAGVLRGQPKR
jgi:hypothetical protein